MNREDGEVDYSGYDLETLRGLELSINRRKYPKSYANLKREMAKRRDESLDEESFGDSFAITPALYKWYLWVVLLTVLASDFAILPSIFSGEIELSLFTWFTLLLGILLKASILVSLIKMKGPLGTLVYIWAGLMVAAGILGLLAISAATETASMNILLRHIVLIGLGVSLAAPISRCVRSVEPSN